MVDTDGVLEHLLESIKGRLRTAQIVLPQSKVKQEYGQPRGGSSGDLGANKTLEKSLTAALLATCRVSC
jgi:hypothetical protein